MILPDRIQPIKIERPVARDGRLATQLEPIDVVLACIGMEGRLKKCLPDSSRIVRTACGSSARGRRVRNQARDCARERAGFQFKPGAPAVVIQRLTSLWLLSLVGVGRALLMPMPPTPSGCGRSAGFNGWRGRMIDVLEILRDRRVGGVLARLCVT